MQVKVTGRHMNPTESTRNYAEEKFGRIAEGAAYYGLIYWILRALH